MAAKRAKGQPRLSLSARRSWVGRLFVYPWMLGTLVFVLVPIGMSLHFTLNSMSLSGSSGFDLTFVGLANYEKALTKDTFFYEYFFLALKDVAIRLPLVTLYSLFAATLLNQKFKGRGFVRSMFFLPVIITSGALVYALNMHISQDSATSSASVMLTNWNIEQLLTRAIDNVPVVTFLMGILDQVFVILWASGVQILIFLAGLQSIPGSIYESARVDGATGWETFWMITVPMILPLVVVNVVYTIIDSYTDYNNRMLQYILEMTTGTTQTYGSTLAWLYFLTMFVFILLMVFGLRKLSDHYAE